MEIAQIGPGHPAWKLAEATNEARSNADPAILERAFEELKPTSKAIAQAYALCLTRAPFASAPANYMTLETRLQVALMQEHVAAQERMGRTLNVLTAVLVVLTLLLVVFGLADLADKWTWSWRPWR